MFALFQVCEEERAWGARITAVGTEAIVYVSNGACTVILVGLFKTIDECHREAARRRLDMWV